MYISMQQKIPDFKIQYHPIYPSFENPTINYSKTGGQGSWLQAFNSRKKCPLQNNLLYYCEL